MCLQSSFNHCRFLQHYSKMKKYKVGLILLALFSFAAFFIVRKVFNTKNKLITAQEEIRELSASNDIHDGDIIFQTSLSAQSKAIQIATASKYSHCGIVYKENNNYYVFEAIQPVKKTLIEEWIARGKEGRYVIKRLKNADAVLTKTVLQKMKKAGEELNGKNYDITFEWSDDKIYCSELVWKIYKRAADLEVGKLEKLKDFDLSAEIVKKKMLERYGAKIPLDEIVISPKAIFESELLVTVKEN